SQMRARRSRRAEPATARRGARGAAPRAQTLVNWSFYRIGWMLVLLPALVVLVGARGVSTLPPAPLPETFDGGSALASTRALVTAYPDRSVGGVGDQLAASWVAAHLRALALPVVWQRFRAPDASGNSV